MEALWRQGHRDITLDIGELNAPAASAAVLTSLVADLAVVGVLLTVDDASDD